MNPWLWPPGLFLGAYFVNIFYITVLYHRGLAHSSVVLRPRTRAWVVATGSWVTGIDPKAWACMHRLHHRHSDTVEDPHSPWHLGVFGVAMGQLKSYEKTLRGLIHNRKEYTDVVRDLDFSVNRINRSHYWWLPYAVHLAIAALIVAGLRASALGWAAGAGYWLGMMSHPIQGWMVNSLAHRFGYRNFASADQSRNNTAVAWLVMGEGFQNNHHECPTSAKFSVRWFEFDGGYLLCLLAERLGWLRVARSDRMVSNLPSKTRDKRFKLAHLTADGRS